MAHQALFESPAIGGRGRECFAEIVNRGDGLRVEVPVVGEVVDRVRKGLARGGTVVVEVVGEVFSVAGGVVVVEVGDVGCFVAGTGGRAERCLLYTSPSPRDSLRSRMPSSA